MQRQGPEVLRDTESGLGSGHYSRPPGAFTVRDPPDPAFLTIFSLLLGVQVSQQATSDRAVEGLCP
jgi:hypothetical protein